MCGDLKPRKYLENTPIIPIGTKNDYFELKLL